MKIILDPGHGITTKGKRSPDGSLLEYKYCRELMWDIKARLEDLGHEVFVTVEDDTDVPLSKRCRYVNSLCDGEKDFILVSIHCNAAGMGKDWLSAKGFSVFVANNASHNSTALATSIAKAASDNGLFVRKYTPKQWYWKKSLAICRDTKCPAILTENLFMDNKEDTAFLLSKEGRETIINLHIDGITNYINTINTP